MPALIDIPGVDEKQVWVWLHEKNPLIRDRMPSNDDAEGSSPTAKKSAAGS
jgi:hypothetical protein